MQSLSHYELITIQDVPTHETSDIHVLFMQNLASVR